MKYPPHPRILAEIERTEDLLSQADELYLDIANEIHESHALPFRPERLEQYIDDAMDDGIEIPDNMDEEELLNIINLIEHRDHLLYDPVDPASL